MWQRGVMKEPSGHLEEDGGRERERERRKIIISYIFVSSTSFQLIELALLDLVHVVVQ